MAAALHEAAPLEGKLSLRTRLSYSIGCIGRDANYTLVSSFIMTYLTLAVGLTNWQLGAVGVVMIIARVWDAVNDPMMGMIIDSTRSRWGKFKPYIICGALLNCVFTILLFTSQAGNEQLFVLIFAITYILWGMTYTMNDISYWGMLPSLTQNPQQREGLTSFVRIFASLGAFIITALVPILTAGHASTMYRTLAIAVAVVFVACQLLVVIGVQQPRSAITKPGKKQTLKSMALAIVKNDQLLTAALVLLLIDLGFFIVVGFGVQYFYFVYGVYGGPQFTIFAAVLAVTQVLTLALAPVIFKKTPRKTQFTIGAGMMIVGYAGFMLVGILLPMSMACLIPVGFVLFAGQAITQLVTYVALADTVEYGQWKLGERNESVTFSLRPFVDKVAGAVQAGIFSVALLLSGLNAFSNEISAIENDGALSSAEKILAGNEVVAGVPESATLILRAFMLLIPLGLSIASLILYRTRYKVDEAKYAQILGDLHARAGAGDGAAEEANP